MRRTMFQMIFERDWQDFDNFNITLRKCTEKYARQDQDLSDKLTQYLRDFAGIKLEK